MADRVDRRWGAAIVAGAAVLCYVNSLGNDFTLDDVVIVQKNPLVTGEAGLLAIWTTDYWYNKRETTPDRDLLYRPMTVLSYRLNAAVGGMRPFGFHLVNVLLHGAVSVLLFMFACRFLSKTAAILGGVLFAVMPIHVEAVDGVVGRAELLVALFTLCGLMVVGRKPVLAVIFVLAALLSKESGAAGVALVPLWGVLEYGRRRNDASHDLSARQAVVSGKYRYCVVLMAGVVVCLAGYLALRWHALGGVLTSSRVPSSIDNVLVDAGLEARFWSAWMLLGMYLVKTFWPAVLVMDYSFAALVPATSLLDVHVLVGLGWAALSGVLLWKGRWWTRFLVLAMWVGYLPVSNSLVLIKTTFAERVWYLPSLWLAALMGTGAGYVAGRWEVRRLIVVLTCILAVAGVGRCWVRNAEWRNNGTLFASAYRDQPKSVMVLATYGRWLCEQGDLERGIPLLGRAVTMHPGFTSAQGWLGEALLEAGRPDEAMQRFLVVQSQHPQHPMLDPWLARTREVLGSVSERSLSEARAAVAADAGDWLALERYVNLLQSAGQTAEAISVLEAAADHFTGQLRYHHRFGQLLMDAGRRDEAIAQFERATSIEDAPAAILAELAMILLDRGNSGDRDRAFSLVDRAWSVQPEDEQVRISRAVTWSLAGRRSEAVVLYRRLLAEVDAGDPRRAMFEAQIRALGGGQ